MSLQIEKKWIGEEAIDGEKVKILYGQALKGLDVNDIELLTAEDGRVRNEMVDKRLEGEFVDFHNKMATLRVISKSANLSIVKRQPNNQNQN
jgi:hypothetical protein